VRNALPRRRSTPSAVAAVVLTGAIVAASLVLTTCTREADSSWPLSVAVVGDAFTAGESNGVVWPTLLAQRTGWSVSNFAMSDAGFAADGRGGHAFTHQVERAQAARPRIILITTGQADNDLPEMTAVTVGAIDAFDKIQLGGQRALVIGPIWYAQPVPKKVKMVSEAVREAARIADVPFLSGIDPPWLSAGLMQGHLHSPNDAGQSVIADRVAAWLRTEIGV
jgi:hypothetical protein